MSILNNHYKSFLKEGDRIFLDLAKSEIKSQLSVIPTRLFMGPDSAARILGILYELITYRANAFEMAQETGSTELRRRKSAYQKAIHKLSKDYNRIHQAFQDSAEAGYTTLVTSLSNSRGYLSDIQNVVSPSIKLPTSQSAKTSNISMIFRTVILSTSLQTTRFVPIVHITPNLPMSEAALYLASVMIYPQMEQFSTYFLMPVAGLYTFGKVAGIAGAKKGMIATSLAASAATTLSYFNLFSLPRAVTILTLDKAIQKLAPYASTAFEGLSASGSLTMLNTNILSDTHRKIKNILTESSQIALQDGFNGNEVKFNRSLDLYLQHCTTLMYGASMLDPEAGLNNVTLFYLSYALLFNHAAGQMLHELGLTATNRMTPKHAGFIDQKIIPIAIGTVLQLGANILSSNITRTGELPYLENLAAIATTFLAMPYVIDAIASSSVYRSVYSKLEENLTTAFYGIEKGSKQEYIIEGLQQFQDISSYFLPSFVTSAALTAQRVIAFSNPVQATVRNVIKVKNGLQRSQEITTEAIHFVANIPSAIQHRALASANVAKRGFSLLGQSLLDGAYASNQFAKRGVHALGLGLLEQTASFTGFVADVAS